MSQELLQIETLTLKDYIDKQMTKLHRETLELYKDAMNNMIEIMEHQCQLIALQEIAYRLEYGFIVEIGSASLKHHLAKTE